MKTILRLCKSGFCTLLFACSFAPAAANAIGELSSPGGTFTTGSGSSLVTFTIAPFDLTFPPSGVLTAGDFGMIGEVTLPQVADNFNYSAAKLELTQSTTIENPLYTLAQNLEGDDITWSLEMFPLLYGADQLIEFQFSSVVGPPGSEQPFTLQAQIVDNASVPEPASWLLAGGGLVVVFARLKRPSFQ